MKKYADTPMAFVDACLVTMTEAKRDCRLTLDLDFWIIAGLSGRPFRCLFRENKSGWRARSAWTARGGR